MKSEHGKLIFGAVLLVVAFGVYWFVGRQPTQLASSLQFVCVADGKTYWISRNSVSSTLPAPHPNTGERTLLPCEERDGKIYVKRKFAPYVQELEQAKVNKYVDAKTLEVLESPRQ